MGVAGRVGVVGRRPGVGMVTDEGGGVLQTGHLEVRLSGTYEGGHTRKGTRGNPDNRRAASPSPDFADTLWEEEETKTESEENWRFTDSPSWKQPTVSV